MRQQSTNPAWRVVSTVLALIGAGLLTLTFFLTLPLLQKIGEKRTDQLTFTSVDTVLPPPPPPPIEEPEEEEPEEEPEPPELNEPKQLLDLSQLDLALNPSFGDGFLQGDFKIELNPIGGGGSDSSGLFNPSDLDQKPRVVYQPLPTMDAKLRRKAPGSVEVIFIVDANGRVQSPKVIRSSDPVFERPALASVKQWRFEPGRRDGEPVQTKMKVPIAFPKR